LSSTTEPEVPVLADAGLEHRDELVAEVEERAAVHARHGADVEQPAVERDRAIDVVDLERHVVDAHRSRAVSVRVHARHGRPGPGRVPPAIRPRTGPWRS
jgi:hypothetical protein